MRIDLSSLRAARSWPSCSVAIILLRRKSYLFSSQDIKIASKSPFQPSNISFSHPKQVIKEDVTVKSFDEFLRFVYTDRVQVDVDSWEHLLYLSCRFGVDRLKDLVEEYTLKMVRLDDVGEVLTVAHQAKALRLKEACFKIMVKNFAYFQGKIAEISEQVPDLLLEMLVRMPK